MSPSSKHARDAARARAERQAAKRAAQRRRQQIIRASVAGGLVLVVLLAVLISNLSHSKKKAADTLSQTTPAPSTAAVSGDCSYTGSPQKASRDVGTPPATPEKKVKTATLDTSVGTIAFTMDGTKAPCTTNAFTYLASKKYFDNTSCHRLTDTGIYVLQCGDPSGTGSGGPGFQYKDENLTAYGTGASVIYPRGTVAMANAGAGTNGSQFFLVYKDSPLAPNYTPIGRITKGLDLIDKVAKAGIDPAKSPAPKIPVVIKTFTVS